MERGNYFWEFQIVRCDDNAHIRIGCCLLFADLDAPIGFDSFSYGYKDVDGNKIHNRIQMKYGSSFKTGDTVGVYLHLPPFSFSNMSHSVEVKCIYIFILVPPTYGENHSYMPLSIYPDSYVEFYLNGKSQGIAYKDLYYGSYYPIVSLYMDGSVKLNPGPQFKFPPKDKPFHSLYDIYEQHMNSLLTPLSDVK